MNVQTDTAGHLVDDVSADIITFEFTGEKTDEEFEQSIAEQVVEQVFEQDRHVAPQLVPGVFLDLRGYAGRKARFAQ